MTSLLQWWREWRCGHWWRPARDGVHPAKWCDDCGKHVRITEAEFYAEFGTVFHILGVESTAMKSRPHPQ